MMTGRYRSYPSRTSRIESAMFCVMRMIAMSVRLMNSLNVATILSCWVSARHATRTKLVSTIRKFERLFRSTAPTPPNRNPVTESSSPMTAIRQSPFRIADACSCACCCVVVIPFRVWRPPPPACPAPPELTAADLQL